MKYVESKSWPWPVLRVGSDDYTRCESEVTLTLKKAEGNTAVEVEATFVVSDRDLKELIAQGRAEYVLLVSCSKTHVRDRLSSQDDVIAKEYENGELAGAVELAPFVVATEQLDGFVSENWHEDYQGRPRRIPAGAVLALDQPSGYWIEAADETPVSSIFRIGTSERANRGEWFCGFEEGRVYIQLHHADFDRFMAARKRADAETRDNILNAVYLSALIWLLVEADNQQEPEPEHQLWWDAIDTALQRAELKPLGAEERDYLRDAQALLKQPFSKLPLLREAAS